MPHTISATEGFDNAQWHRATSGACYAITTQQAHELELRRASGLSPAAPSPAKISIVATIASVTKAWYADAGDLTYITLVDTQENPTSDFRVGWNHIYDFIDQATPCNPLELDNHLLAIKETKRVVRLWLTEPPVRTFCTIYGGHP